MPQLQARFFASRDGSRLRAAVFGAAPAAPARGLCVLLHGQTEFIEKYQEVIDELCGRGFTVATFDWRSQGGSHRPLADPLKIHVGDFAEYDGDLAAFMDTIVGPLDLGSPLALAHSMGGHILLRALKARPGLFRAAVLSAPMIAMQTRGYPQLVARSVCKLENLLARDQDWVWGMDQADPLCLGFETQRVTRDPARYARTKARLRAAPELRTNGPSWGWLEAAYRSIARMGGADYGPRIATPVLACGAGHDQVVVTAACARLIAQLPLGRYVHLPDAEHEILMERDGIRAQFWAEFDRFVARAPSPGQ